jgi:hypothetical protein
VQLEDERSCAREPLGGGLDKPPVELEASPQAKTASQGSARSG